MKYMIPVLVALALVPTVYYFFLFRRIEKTLGLDAKKPVWVAVRILLCLIVWHFTWQVTSTVAIILYFIALTDIAVRLVDLLIRKITKKSNEEAGRKCWQTAVGLCLIPAALVTTMFIYGTVNIRNIVETHYTVTTDKDIPEDGFRICFFSDVHCGVAVGPEEYERVSREIDSKKADAVILGGDLLDFLSEQEEVEAMFASFGSIRTTCGIYYIFGNHDRTGDYKESVFTEEYIIGLCEKNGIKVLQDEQVSLGNGILLVGREDSTTKYGRIRKTPEELLEGVDEDKFILVADHEPTDYAKLAANGADTVLNGHLHVGQIIPVNLLIQMYNSEHVIYGRYFISQNGTRRAEADGPAKNGDGTATSIVTSGLVGWAYPIRTSGHSEYCIIDLVKE